MTVVKVKISELKFAEYNPRQLTSKQHGDLMESIKRFGIVDPVIVNRNPDRKNVIVGGHMRVKIARELGFTEIDCVYVDLDIEKEKELNLRLNKNVGEWDFDLLSSFDDDLLVDVGFEDKDLELVVEDEQPELEFSDELLLEHNYVVLYFDNAMDWEVAQDKLGLKQVKDLIPRKGQPKGVCRVINGKDIIEKL